MNGKFKNPCSVHTRLKSQLVFSICWNPKEVGFSASEGVDVLARQQPAAKASLYGLPAEGGAHIKARCLPASDEAKQSLTGLPSIFGF
ncbi:hypothetical protein I79_026029 [Cricetulus griseus]|uniref:Uncharacterized protein n=1 Tax=Cricetulus griseus TaxID=10029 RepID=G3IPU9_CRIGR|nr:hypothetical protein I79_026029 [Cricetulus griseus]